MRGNRPLDKVTCAFTAAYGIDDVELVYAVLATAVNVHDDTDPLWLMIIGPPSGGKTTASMITADLPRVTLDDLTAASLISAHHDTRDHQWKMTGLLHEKVGQGGRRLWVIEDFSSVLSMADRGGREQLFAYLRKVYDGRLSRTIANCPLDLSWHGRLAVIAACTSAIDNQSAYGDELGPRFVYLRLKDNSREHRAVRLRAARGMSKDALTARALAASVVGEAHLNLPDLDVTETLHDHLDLCALVGAYGRTSVGRDSTWKREVFGVIETEEPFRLRNQLMALARGCLAMGLDEDETARVAARIARDSMPRARRDALAAVIHLGEEAIPLRIAREMKVSQKTALFALEDLAWAGMLEHRVIGKSGPHEVTCWSVVPEFREAVLAIYKGYWLDKV